MKKIIGYLIALVGLVGLAMYTIPQIKAQITLPVPIDDTSLLIISIALVVIGVFISVKSEGRRKMSKGREVPIYHGKNIVGYRRG